MSELRVDCMSIFEMKKNERKKLEDSRGELDNPKLDVSLLHTDVCELETNRNMHEWHQHC